MIVNPVDNVSFGTRSVLKKEFNEGKIPLKRDITGHELRRGEVSLDHTIPKSKGGCSNLSNYSLMNMAVNNKRGVKPLKHYIDVEALVEYIRVMLDVKTIDLDGVEYLRKWLKTLSKALKQNL